MCANLARPTPRARPCLLAHKPTLPSAAVWQEAQDFIHRPAQFADPALSPLLRVMKVPLAGADAAGNPTETLLSEVGLVLLRFFDTREACVLRLICREFTEAVGRQQWEDRETVILGSIATWRACFPRARCANVRMWAHPDGVVRTAPVVDSDFVHFEGLRELSMAGCRAVTDAAFAHLRGIHTLDMMWCNQPAITDAAFVHLRGIQVLNLSECRSSRT